MRLSDKIDMPVYKLSGDEQQRIAVARLLIKSAGWCLPMNPQAHWMKKCRHGHAAVENAERYGQNNYYGNT